MQGSIYTAFSDMIIDTMGMEQWNELLEETAPPSKGIYTSGDQYDDKELIDMVVYLSVKTGLPTEDLVQKFGHYLFGILYKKSPVNLSKLTNLRDFLLAIDKVIHVEVKRLHPNAYLPTFDYEDGKDGQLIMYYQSKRKLCHASIGLIQGAAEKFNERVDIEHPECMHHGADRCKLVIKFDR